MAEAALNIEPSSATFPAAGGNAKHEVVNLTDNRLGFKVKSSNNEHYRVKPVFGFVAPKGRTTLELIRLPGPAKEDKIVVQWAEVPAEEEDPQAPFKAGAACGEVILPLKAE
ncbi:MSP domain-containing protein [Aphelenchoides besseyi]|nr:MSP domain-containing protein [Aphelenchoides besseyi]KAI6217515.1 MSP domain-containing protein [Aphelenchoides besseyi]